MNEYPRLPDPPAPEPDQTREHYGLALLAFVIRTGITCTCTAEQLALALHVAPIASAVTVTGPKDDRQVDRRTATADAVAGAKRLILETQRTIARMALEAETAETPAPEAETGPGPGGPKIPRTPYPIAPAPSTYATPQPAPALLLNF